MHFGLSHPALAAIALNTHRPEKMRRNVEVLSTDLPALFWDEIWEKGLIQAERERLTL
jgi:D-threo-aldose 1-dehydrogenase